MKKIIYDEAINIENLLDVYKIIRSNTKNKKKLVAFELFLSSNLVNIYNALKYKNYNHGKYNIFLIKKPKLRVILSESLNDKIVNHLVSKYMLFPVILPTLIDANIATVKNKGSSYGIKLLKKYINNLKTKYDNIYILKLDIKKYFFNIDHQILYEKLRKIIKDEDCLKLVENIIDSTNASYVNENINNLLKKLPTYSFKKGLPIGNMSSQLLAIFYLSDVDHYIKEKLKIKHYIRYMDDFVLLHYDKNYLKDCLNKITLKLEELKLMLNDKTEIYNLKSGFNFLGYRFKLVKKHLVIKVLSKNKYRIKRKLQYLKINDYNKYKLSISSYKGYFMKK